MGGDVRTTVGVPKLSAFANGSGTPIVIDTLTGQGYFTDKNTVVPLATPAFEQSLTENGYVKLPGGLIIQWGYSGGPTAAITGRVTFPVVFPVVAVSIMLTPFLQTGDGGGPMYVTASDPTGFTWNRNDNANAKFLSWIALGY